MIPARPNAIVIYQGDSFDYPFRIRERNADGTKGEPLNLTGCQVLSQIRLDDAARTLLVTLQGAVAADQVASKGVVNLNLTPAQTAALEPPVAARPDANGLFPLGVWDVQLTWPSGEVKTYLKTTVLLDREVSR